MADPVSRATATSTPSNNVPNASPTNDPGGGSLNGNGGSGAGQDSSSVILNFPHGTSTSSYRILPDPSSTPTPSNPGILPPASTSILSFNNTASFGENLNDRVYYSDSRARTFSWTYDSSNTNLVNISWYGTDTTGKPFNVSQATIIASAEFGGPVSSAFVRLNDNSAVLNLTASTIKPWYEKEMVVNIQWTTDDEEKGFSQSGVFTVASRDDSTFDAAEFTRNVTKAEQDRQGFESITSQGSQSTPGPSSVSSSKSSGGGGLSTGAIVGIAVACAVVGIALLAGLVWFLLRRRRRRSVGQGYKATRQTTNSFSAVKEARPSVAESPVIVSPFTDDGEARGFSNSNIAIGLPPRGSTPRGVPAINADGDRPESAASSSRPRGGIAHLVEEGMTEADILRLEEEERHLDAEIERAARRGSS